MQTNGFNTKYFFGLLLLAGTVVALVLWPFFTAIVVAGTLAVIFQDPYQWFLKATRGAKGLSSFLVCLLVAFLIILPLVILTGLVVSEIRDAYVQYLADGELLARYLAQIETLLSSLGFPSVGDQILNQNVLLGKLEQAGSVAVGIVQTVYTGTTQFVFWLFVMFFSLFYFLIDGKALVDRLVHLSPLRNHQERFLVKSFESIGRATIKGTLLIGLIQGMLGTIFFVAAGLPSPVTWGVVMVVLSIIPMLGAGLVLFPAGIILLFSGDFIGAAIIIIGGTIVTLTDNYLRPKMVGKDTAIHPLLVFFSTLGGIALFGVMGFIIGPVFMAFFLALLNIYEREFEGQLREYNK